MSLFFIEVHEIYVVIIGALLEKIPVFDHIDVLQAVVICVDVGRIAALADVEDALVCAVQEEDGGLPCLPVKVGM